MRIYSFYPNSEGALALMTEVAQEYFCKHFIGHRMRQSWKLPTFRILRHSRPIRDFVGWNLAALTITEKAKAALEPLIGEDVEFLPFATIKGKRLYAVNVIRIIDCLDMKKSNMSFSSDIPGRVIFAMGFMFDPKKVEPCPIFKVPQWRGSIFVSHDFVEVVVRSKLTGAGFDNPEKILFVKRPWDGTLRGLPAVRDFDQTPSRTGSRHP